VVSSGVLDPQTIYREMAEALRRAEERATQAERQLADVRARFDKLVDVLVAAGPLVEGHRTLLAKVGEIAVKNVKPRVKLRMFVDKYKLRGADIDCAARLHLCRARCCMFTFELTEQDLEEGRIAWEVTQPYKIRHEADDYCTHLDRQKGGCTVHAHRPAPCRSFDCRHDPRIWEDFEKGIPAPMPETSISFPAPGA
jgi:Fe-S-cluster containining protein